MVNYLFVKYTKGLTHWDFVGLISESKTVLAVGETCYCWKHWIQTTDISISKRKQGSSLLSVTLHLWDNKGIDVFILSFLVHGSFDGSDCLVTCWLATVFFLFHIIVTHVRDPRGQWLETVHKQAVYKINISSLDYQTVKYHKAVSVTDIIQFIHSTFPPRSPPFFSLTVTGIAVQQEAKIHRTAQLLILVSAVFLRRNDNLTCLS